MMFLVLASFAFAEDPNYIFKRGESIDLKIICMNGDSACSNLAKCNVTANYPNLTYLVNNVAMTNNNGYFNYSLGSLDTLGTYPSALKCIDGNLTKFSAFSFEITDNGSGGGDYTLILALGIVVFLLIVVAIVLQIDSKFALALRLTCILFAVMFAIMIPAYFTTIDVKVMFYRTFIGFLSTLGIILFLWGFYAIFAFFGIIGGAKS